MKKTISLLLSFVMIITMAVPISANAGEAKGKWINGGYYVNNHLKDIKYNYKGKFVVKSGTTAIDEWVGYLYDNITEVVIPDSVKNIGTMAFSRCKSLTKVKMGNNVKQIGSSVFSVTPYSKSHTKNGIFYIGKYLINYNNDKLTSYKIKKGTKIVSDTAFSHQLPLKKLYIPESVTNIGCDFANINISAKINQILVDKNNKNYASKEGVLFNKKLTKLICYPQYKDYVSYIVPKTVEILGKYSFYNNRNLLNLKLNNNLDRIEEYAIYNVRKIKTLVIPKSVNKIAAHSVGMADIGSDDRSYQQIENIIVYKNSAGEKYVTKGHEDEGMYVEFHHTFVCKKHVYTDKKGKEPTYFAYGYTDYHQCKNCGIYKGFIQRKKLKLAVPKVTVKAGKKNIKISYKKVKDATGFQVKYTKGKKSVTKTYKTSKSAAKTIKKLKKGSYQVQVRAYIQKDSKKAYSSWTKAKTVKVR